MDKKKKSFSFKNKNISKWPQTFDRECTFGHVRVRDWGGGLVSEATVPLAYLRNTWRITNHLWCYLSNPDKTVSITNDTHSTQHHSENTDCFSSQPWKQLLIKSWKRRTTSQSTSQSPSNQQTIRNHFSTDICYKNYTRCPNEEPTPVLKHWVMFSGAQRSH